MIALPYWPRCCPYCEDGLLQPIDGITGRCDDCGRIHTPGMPRGSIDLNEHRKRLHELEASRPAWWGDANHEEVRAFNLGGPNRPDGSGVPALEDRELRCQLAVADQRLKTARTRWLEAYAAHLVAESRARRGVA